MFVMKNDKRESFIKCIPRKEAARSREPKAQIGEAAEGNLFPSHIVTQATWYPPFR